ncbi:DUF6169 family protein [Mucilaginibacter sp.]|uniref:DUF6169 family protein n=1 Tax=Mucilaginibacter sp. TaxID=1882438 RepID=UPI00283EADE7|nr:DUF6169 family protein [Mucilaginibacter sp.]MDR3693028.1 DUF6169 family protein [Mucilaginibacter sp.]
MKKNVDAMIVGLNTQSSTLSKRFFYDQNDNAILYVCINNDEKARNRHITFCKWYNEFGQSFEKHSSSELHGKLGFYGSILFKKDNPNKQKLIDSFYFTINIWGLNEG